MRRLLAITVALTCAVTVSACSIRNPSEPDLESAIPQALLASDLGIVTAEAGNGVDGASTYVSVFIGVKRDKVTSAELHQILEIIVDNSNLGPYNLRVNAIDETNPDLPGQARSYINLAEPARELGLESNDDEAFIARWDDVVAYLDGQ
jgi:hypothetical protein